MRGHRAHGNSTGFGPAPRHAVSAARLGRGRLAAVLIGCLLTLGPGAGSASGAAMVIGESAPVSPLAYCKGGPAELMTTSTAGGNAFAAPASGVLISWSTMAAFVDGQQLGMKVYRPVPNVPDTYTVIAHDGPRALKSGAFNTFETHIPVQAGDIVGLYEFNGSEAIPNACFYNNLVATDYLAIIEGSAPDGVSVYMPPIALAARPNVSAMLQPRPTIAATSPSSGPVSGGTPVVITGTDLENTVSVNFGGAAASFTPISETELLATTPPGPGPGNADVTVRTSAGSATGRFVYEGGAGTVLPTEQRASASCVVPKLTGRALRGARLQLSRARCSLGTVRGAKKRRRAARVARQRPPAGRVLRVDAKVDVTLRVPRRHPGRRR